MRFEVSVSDEDRLKFAEISGDKNPLHIDQEYSSIIDTFRKGL